MDIAAFIKHIIDLSGGLPIVMAVVFLLALAVVIERLWFYLKVFPAGHVAERELAEAADSIDQLETLAARFDQTIQGRLIRTALAAGPGDIGRLDRMLDEEIMKQMPELDRYLWMLDTAVTLGPLLGLFGTIIGMIDTFNVLGSGGAAIKATGGIADALVSTGMGLFIAIISVSFLNFFNKRLRLALHQLDLIRVMLINTLEGRGRSSLQTRSSSQEHYESLSAEAKHMGMDDLRGAEGA
jgi:biopolymer transport protein ExbB